MNRQRTQLRLGLHADVQHPDRRDFRDGSGYWNRGERHGRYTRETSREDPAFSDRASTRAFAYALQGTRACRGPGHLATHDQRVGSQRDASSTRWQRLHLDQRQGIRQVGRDSTPRQTRPKAQVGRRILYALSASSSIAESDPGDQRKENTVARYLPTLRGYSQSRGAKW
jgi:hypothetical protein